MATQPSTAIATIPTEESERFGLMQREARLFASSPLIPQHLRQGGPEQAMANCYIALKMARTMGEDPLVVLQNIHVVNGKAGFASQYMIARANSSGVFKGRINWRVDKSDPKNLAVTAFATLADTGELVEFTADMAMATAEGWTKNPKYRTMPEVMLRYRSAAFLVRFYAPDVMLGYHTADEVEDVIAAASMAPSATALTADMLTDQAETPPADEPETVEAEPVEDEAATEDPQEPEAEQAGEGDPAAAEQSESERRLTVFRERIAAADGKKALDAIDKDWVLARAAYDDATAAEIDGLIAARKRELAAPQGGEGK
jgi:hypothetical protein